MGRSAVVTALAVVAVAAASCGSKPAPTNSPAPTALPCPGPEPGDPGFVSSQHLVPNGSFGSPVIHGSRIVTSLPGWTISGPVRLVASPSCLPFLDNQYVRLSSGGSIEQSVPTVAGGVYDLTIAEAPDGVCNTAEEELKVFWNATGFDADVLLATGTTPDPAGPDMPWGAFGVGTSSVVAQGAQSLLRITVATAAATCGFDVSDIGLAPRPPSTPTP